MKILYKIFLVLIASAGIAHAYSNLGGGIFKSDGSASDTQAAISAAPSGSTVQIPSGTYAWSSTVTISTPITLAGAGASGTTIQGNQLLNINSSGTPRITGITFDGGQSSVILVQFYGIAPGLIDHCAFIGGNASEMIHNMGMGASDGSGWTTNVYPGTINALYVEDCTFTKNPLADQYQWGTSAIQSYYGARTVVRHCTLNYCQIDQHGTPGAIGARWWEIYDNVLNVPSQSAGECSFLQLRGGSGVIFGNSVTSSQKAYITLYEEDSGYPAAYQVGRGINQNYSPAYLWGNNSNCDIGSGSSNVVSGRDFFVSTSQPGNMIKWQLITDNASTTYSYTSFTYPHPMVSSGSTPVSPGTAPVAPLNLRITQ